jgi:hypothetical protein
MMIIEVFPRLSPNYSDRYGMHGLLSEHGYRSPGWPLMVRLLDILGTRPVARASSITAFTSPLNQDPANNFFFEI